MKLLTRSRRPPTGWVYLQADTQTSFDSPSLDALTALVQKHRIGNKLPRTAPEQIRQDIESYLCDLMRGTRAVFVFCDTGGIALPPPKRSSAGNGSHTSTVGPGVMRIGPDDPMPKLANSTTTTTTTKASAARTQKRRCRGCGGV